MQFDGVKRRQHLEKKRGGATLQKALYAAGLAAKPTAKEKGVALHIESAIGGSSIYNINIRIALSRIY